MKHLCVAFAAMILLACGLLQAFDTGPAPVLVSGLQAAPHATPAPRHSGVLRDSSSFSEIIPPERFQGDGGAVVIFGGMATVRKLCAGVKLDDGATAPLACSGVNDKGTPIIVAPNPCLAAQSDLYAAILCHELGHLNGWPSTHGD
jgi:hypothetical protein